jgi:hypothetical protein
MGYRAHQTAGAFCIKSSQIAAALAAVEAWRVRERCVADGATGAPSERLVELFSEEGWGLDVDGQTGDVTDIQFEDEKYRDNEDILRVVAPFVVPGSSICMLGEDDEAWRWYFDGQEMVTQPGSLIYEPAKVVVEVRGGVAEVTDCPHGIEVEIIDHDNREAAAEEEQHADRAA